VEVVQAHRINMHQTRQQAQPAAILFLEICLRSVVEEVVAGIENHLGVACKGSLAVVEVVTQLDIPITSLCAQAIAEFCSTLHRVMMVDMVHHILAIMQVVVEVRVNPAVVEEIPTQVMVGKVSFLQ
jgi:phage-related protein